MSINFLCLIIEDMRIVCRILLIFCMFFVAIVINAFCSSSCSESFNRSQIVSDFKSFDFDILLNNNYSRSLLQNLNSNNSIFVLNNKKTDNCQNYGNNKFLVPHSLNIEHFPELFYLKNIFKNNSGINIVMFFPQIQPNAP